MKKAEPRYHGAAAGPSMTGGGGSYGGGSKNYGQGFNQGQFNCSVQMLHYEGGLLMLSLGPSHTTAKTTATVTVAFTATAKNTLNQPHSKLCSAKNLLLTSSSVYPTSL